MNYYTDGHILSLSSLGLLYYRASVRSIHLVLLLALCAQQANDSCTSGLEEALTTWLQVLIKVLHWAVQKDSNETFSIEKGKEYHRLVYDKSIITEKITRGVVDIVAYKYQVPMNVNTRCQIPQTYTADNIIT